MDLALIISALTSGATTIGGYFIHSYNKRLEILENSKLDKESYHVQVDNLKDDIKEIKDNVEYIRRKLESKHEEMSPRKR